MRQTRLTIHLITFLICIYANVGVSQVFDSKSTLYTGQSYSNYYTESVFSAIDSHDGDIYFVMIDENRRPFIGKISDGVTDVQPLTNEYQDYVTRDDGHHELSIGIDKDGYIHVAGDMHNHPQMDVNHLVGDAAVLQTSDILYWKSDVPGDISSFSFMGFSANRIPGKAFSYGHFFTDRNGELFYSARTLARSYYYQKPQDGGVGRGLGLYAYNTSTQSWTARGELADMYGFSDANHKVIVYDPSGHGGNTSYQQYKGDFYFDKNNRMHMALGMNTDGHSDVNNVIYAYSDDGGVTFHKADGTSIQLPMTAEANGTYQADRLVHNTTGGIDMDQASVAAAWNDYPVVHYKRGSGKYMYWNGTSWSSEQNAPTSPRDEILFNEHTEQLLFIDIHSGQIYAKNSITGGDETYDAGPRFQYYDIKTFRSQNTLNGISWESSGGSGTYQVIQLNGPDVDPVDCNGEAGGTASVDDCGVCSGGSTGIVPNSTCVQDCNGEWGGSAALDDCNVCAGGNTGVVPCDQDPYGGSAHVIPGIIELEEYDEGANGAAYSDDTPGNTGLEFRTDDVDIEISSSGGYNIGWTAAGEWLEYTVDVQTTTDYDWTISIATDQSGSLHLEMDGSTISDIINVSTSTGGWQTWSVFSNSNPIALTTGEHVIRLYIDQGPLNIDKMEFSISGTPDCNGDIDGTASIDDCGVCSGGSTGITPNSTCVQDCNGNWDGTASIDDCGVCSGGSTGITPNSTCVQDCNGDWDGTASIDNCGVCSGGSTGITPNSTCVQDCNGNWDGTASIDDCGVCSGGSTGVTPNSTCVQDCNGDWDGTASIDDCGVCSGGSTGVTPNSTCVQDCNGNWDGTASIDDCGVCSGGSTGVTPNSTCVQDCNGDWDGTASIDDCGVCSGGNTGVEVDDCLTSVSTNVDDEIKVYPVPVINELYLNYPGEEKQWILSNSLGINISYGTEKKIDMRSLPSGVYYLRIGSQMLEIVKD